MDKLALCRICLANDIPMRLIVNKCLQEMYEVLTKLPFVTDSRPMLVCYICCARLHNSYKLAKSCLQSEQLFQQVLSTVAQTPNKLPSTNTFGIKQAAHMSCPGVSDGTYMRLSTEQDDNTEKQVGSDKQTDNDSVEVKLEPMEEWMPTEDNQCVTDSLKPDSVKAEDSDISEYEADGTNIYDAQQAAGVTESQSSEDTSFHNEKELLEERPGKRSRDERTNNKYNKDASELEHNEKPEIIACSYNLLSKTSHIPYKCNICSKSFSQMSHLVNHTRTHAGKRYECIICSKCFRKKSDLDKHTTIHTGDKPHKCSICDKCFSRKDNLATHMRRHAGDRPFKCDVCNKCFTVKSSLVEHYRIHTGEKPYKCSYCHKCFTKQTDLVRHKRIHTGDKPYKCNVCNKRFSVKCKLDKHNRIHTRDAAKCNVTKVAGSMPAQDKSLCA